MSKVLNVLNKGMDTASDVHYSGAEEGAILNTRLVSDNEHIITRLTRPIIALSLLVLYIFSYFQSANGIEVNPELLRIMKASFPLVLGFYFGSRGLEKIMRLWKQDSKQDRQASRQEVREERKKSRIIRRQR